MIEERIADRFRAAVADEPPLGFDPDDVVTKAARLRRRNRAVAGSALVTTGLAVAATVFATDPGGVPAAGPGSGAAGWVSPAPSGPGGALAPSAPSAQPGSEKPDVPQSTGPATFPGSDAAVARLRVVIPAVLAERVPGLTFIEPDGGDLAVEPKGRLIGGAYRASGTKRRYVGVWVAHDGDTLDLGKDPATAGGWGPLLGESTLPDGSRLRVYGQSGAGAQSLTVLHFRADGVIVLVETTAKPEPGRTGLAVTQEVLTAIATDPRLTF
jgi:hypothetical protein